LFDPPRWNDLFISCFALIEEQQTEAPVATQRRALSPAARMASLGNDGLRIQTALARELGLMQPDIAWHTQRDRIAEAGCFLGLLTGTLAKFATDVKLMMQTEVGELSEPYLPERGSSSTMPQKRNPISCCYIHARAASVRQHVAALLDAMTEDHERATGPWEIEWIVLPQLFTLSAGALSQMRFIVSGLEVHPERMRSNLELTHGLIVSEAVMMGLAPSLGRERAHDLVYELCRKAATSGERRFRGGSLNSRRVGKQISAW
jgi:3-carboxy-cis,cis-muconate cycloisomerase